MLDIITVVFRDELPLLEIQAESIARYINSQDIQSITVVVNDSDDVAELIDTAWWRHNQHLVNVVCFSRWGENSTLTGWENQQLCKLLAASESASTWSMVLDAKTWFIQNLDLNLLFDQQGRPQLGVMKVFDTLTSSRDFIEKLFDVKMNNIIGPNGVPFMFHTETVKEMVNSFDDFIEFFRTNSKYPNLITEFHLYSGYVLKKYGTYDTLYNRIQHYKVLNIADWEAKHFDVLFNILVHNDRLTASIHRRSYKELTPEQLKQWVQFLYDKHLIINIINTQNLLNTYIK
jgi:hypothetical protein